MSNQSVPKVYLASPFFNEKQLSFVKKLESLIDKAGYELFSPRLGENSLVMNEVISVGEDPSPQLRHNVFMDNYQNIDDADLLVAVVDNFDSGVMWEIGYAYARQIPIVTVTDHEYGCNLMLAHSIIAHVKTMESLQDILSFGLGKLHLEASMEDYAEAIAYIQSHYKTNLSLKEGPNERDQFE